VNSVVDSEVTVEKEVSEVDLEEITSGTEVTVDTEEMAVTEVTANLEAEEASEAIEVDLEVTVVTEVTAYLEAEEALEAEVDLEVTEVTEVMVNLEAEEASEEIVDLEAVVAVEATTMIITKMKKSTKSQAFACISHASSNLLVCSSSVLY
jgi:hypothetical protein